MNRRGDPNWCKPLQPIPALLTEFEVEVARLERAMSEYVKLAELKRGVTAIEAACTFRMAARRMGNERRSRLGRGVTVTYKRLARSQRRK